MINACARQQFRGNHFPAKGFLLGLSASPFSSAKRGRRSHGNGITVNKKAQNVEGSQADVVLRAESAYPAIDVGRTFRAP